MWCSWLFLSRNYTLAKFLTAQSNSRNGWPFISTLNALLENYRKQKIAYRLKKASFIFGCPFLKNSTNCATSIIASNIYRSTDSGRLYGGSNINSSHSTADDSDRVRKDNLQNLNRKKLKWNSQKIFINVGEKGINKWKIKMKQNIKQYGNENMKIEWMQIISNNYWCCIW